MLTQDQISTHVGHTFEGHLIYYLCLRCGCLLRSCADPACEDELHHNEDRAVGPMCAEFSIFYADTDSYLRLEYATRDEADNERSGLLIAELALAAYFGIK